MDPQLIDQRLEQLLDWLPGDQAAAIMLAAQRCEPIAQQWFAAQGLAAAHRAYLDAFSRWQAGRASDAELEQAVRPLDLRLNREIEREPDVVGAMAAHAVSDVAAIALQYSPEVLEEMLRTALFFAAAAYTGSQDVPIEVDTERLTRDELQFIAAWWRDCIDAFPDLAD